MMAKFPVFPETRLEGIARVLEGAATEETGTRASTFLKRKNGFVKLWLGRKHDN